MYKFIIGLVVVLMIFVFATHIIRQMNNQSDDINIVNSSNNLRHMNISSTKFEHNTSIPSKYTCDGDNINPPLAFSNIPADARSLVLLMDDPDVPTSVREDGNWDHWVLFNIPPSTTRIEENAIPDGVEGVNTGGKNAYGGPCPPDREHRYFFKLFALDAKLDLEEGASKTSVISAMEGHILTQAELIGLYNRN